MACHRCEELQKELSKTKANFKSLNKKIIPTDLLVKKYKETRSQLDEKTQALEVAERAVCTLRDQLETAMLRGASPSMDFLQLKSDHESTLKELYASREEVDSQRMLIMQLKAHIAKKDEELRRLELEKELRQEEIAEAKAYAKRSEEQVEKLKKQRAEQKDISKELAAAKKNEMALQRKLTTAGEKLQALKSKSVSRNKKKERTLNRYSLPEVKVFSPTKLKQQVRQKSDTESPEKNRSIANGKFSSGLFPEHLSPLPPSPQKSTTNQRKYNQLLPLDSVVLPQDQSIPVAHSQLHESTDESQCLNGLVLNGHTCEDLSCDQAGQLTEEQSDCVVADDNSIESPLHEQTGKDNVGQSQLSQSSCFDSEIEENEKSVETGIVTEKIVMANNLVCMSLSELSDSDSDGDRLVRDQEQPLFSISGDGIGGRMNSVSCKESSKDNSIDDKSSRPKLQGISTKPEECKRTSSTDICTGDSFSNLKHLQDKAKLTSLGSYSTVNQATNHCNRGPISSGHRSPSGKNNHLFSVSVNSTAVQSEKLLLSPAESPAVQPLETRTLVKTTNSLTVQGTLFRVISALESKSNLSPLPLSPVCVQLASTSQPTSSQSSASSEFDSLISSRSQQMDKVINSFQSSGYKRKLMFNASPNSEDSLPSPKRFSAAVPTSAMLIKPKPIRQLQSIDMPTESNEVQSILSTVAHLERNELVAGMQEIATQSHSEAMSVASNQSMLDAKKGHEIIATELEEGELVEEPMEDVEKVETVSSAKTVGQKKDVYNRSPNQTEDSYVLKGLQRLRRQPDDIHKIASGFAVQGNISCPSTLAQRIARSLCQRKDDVGKAVQALCRKLQKNPDADFEPILSEYEKLLLRLVGLVKTAISQRGLVETLLHLLPRQLHQIKENKWNKPFACGMRAACVCRFFASLCRQEGDAERLHVFCYDLLREFTPFTVKELLSLEAIALAWPQAIRRQPMYRMYREGQVYLDAVHPQLTCCVMEALLMTQFKCSTNIQCKVLESIQMLLHWSQVPRGCLATQELTVTMIKFLCHSSAVGVKLSGDCPVLSPISFELVKCLELVSHWMGPSWMDGYLIRQLLCPIIKEWMSDTQQSDKGKSRHSAASVATICRFLGCAGRMASTNNELLDGLVSILSSTLTQVPAMDEGIASVHLCSALSLGDLSPWRPREVQTALKQWTSTVPGTDNSYRFPSLPNLLRHRMLTIIT